MQPNTRAASSTSTGTARNTLAQIRIVVGSDSAVCSRITAYVVSYKPVVRNSCASGTDSTTIGSARVNSRNSW